jgi:hypothetical protein
VVRFRACVSGQELIDIGYEADVDIAVEAETSDITPFSAAITSIRSMSGENVASVVGL